MLGLAVGLSDSLGCFSGRKPGGRGSGEGDAEAGPGGVREEFAP